MERSANDLKSFLRERRERFLADWKILSQKDLREASAGTEGLSDPDFEKIFDAYTDGDLDELTHRGPVEVIELIKSKIAEGFPLSLLEKINARFMETARSLFRASFPDAFNARSEYLERLSQNVLSNEIALAQYYEKYLSDLNARLQRKNEKLLQFMDLATHQLQAPLWSILGFTTKLQRSHFDNLDEKGRHCINRIGANVTEMHQLIEDITRMLFIDPDNMRRTKVFLADLLIDGIQIVRKEIDEDFACEGPVDNSLVIDGDPSLLRELVLQILKNAAVYSRRDRPGKIHFSYELRDGLQLVFADEGIGVDPQYRELVFRPMERLKDKDVMGTGLGLTLAKRIAEVHNGDIRMEDSPYGGVTVRVILPPAIVSERTK